MAAPSPTSKSPPDRWEWFVVALVVMAAAATVPGYAAGWFYAARSGVERIWLHAHVERTTVGALFELAVGLLLVLPHPVRGGLLAVPDLARAPWRTAAVCLMCLGLTYAFDNRLDLSGLRDDGNGYWMWLIGPPAEELLFRGFLFGKFARLWPGPIARWLPVDRAVVLSAAYFSLWHGQGFQSMDPTFVRQQMLYTLAAGFALGLTRQWTGSIAFATLTHVGCNWIAFHGYGLRQG